MKILGRTLEESFLGEAYEFANGDTSVACPIRDIGAKIGVGFGDATDITRALIQKGLLAPMDVYTVCLTVKGCQYVQDLSSR
jgi:hypothetical protein